VRILLDECIDQRFRYELPNHEVRTVQEAGWAGKKNSELLKLAQNEFEVFITVTATFIFSRTSAISRLQWRFLVLEQTGFKI
jgi:hypothetical protein